MIQKYLKIITFITFLIITPFFISSNLLAENKAQVCFKKDCIDVKIAQTNEELMRGLQFRKSLKINEGMLFIFPGSGVYNFWMKDTLIPLDIIWLDENRRIIFITSNLLPCHQTPCPTYGPAQESRYTLEINAGLAKKMKLQVGDTAVFHLP